MAPCHGRRSVLHRDASACGHSPRRQVRALVSAHTHLYLTSPWSPILEYRHHLGTRRAQAVGPLGCAGGQALPSSQPPAADTAPPPTSLTHPWGLNCAPCHFDKGRQQSLPFKQAQGRSSRVDPGWGAVPKLRLLLPHHGTGSTPSGSGPPPAWPAGVPSWLCTSSPQPGPNTTPSVSGALHASRPCRAAPLSPTQPPALTLKVGCEHAPRPPPFLPLGLRSVLLAACGSADDRRHVPCN